MNSCQHLPRSNCTLLASAILLASAMAPHYRVVIDMVHRLQMCHTAGLYASTKAAIAQTASNLGSNLFQFLSSSLLPPTTTSTNSNDGVHGGEVIHPIVKHLPLSLMVKCLSLLRSRSSNPITKHCERGRQYQTG